ncbi:MAG TPA: hypothetical protein VF960_02095 [Chloroflexota bacterium]
MNQTMRFFVLFEGVAFATAGSIHRGVFIHGYEHGAASIAETTIAVVLVAGLILTWVWPVHTRLIGLLAQSFAVQGTLVGLFTIAVGIGPRTIPDLMFHFGILAVLAVGLGVAARSEVGQARGTE